jgi:hypothetical protein
MNLSKYDFAHDGFTPPWAIDKRHRSALYAMAMHCTGNVVEIGCFRGYSTAAFVEALNDGADFTLHLVDLKITDELRRVVSMCSKPDNIVIHETHSTEFRLTCADLWFIDGDHNFAACQDVLNALASNAAIIAMHDTQAHVHGFTECEGAYVAANALKAFPNRYFTEDSSKREREWTHRGFLISANTENPLSLKNAFLEAENALDASQA